MSIILHPYRGQATGHIAWTINGRYFSFEPELRDRSIDLERGPVPLPGGESVFMMTARPSMSSTEADDVAKYVAFEPELISIEGSEDEEWASDPPASLVHQFIIDEPSDAVFRLIQNQDDAAARLVSVPDLEGQLRKFVECGRR